MVDRKIKYIILGFIFWFIVDWATLKGFHLSYFAVPIAGYILRFLNFTLYPLMFAYAAFNRHWSEKKLFILTAISAFLIEVVWLKNALLYTFPHFLVFIPAGICIYSILTFFPLWIVNQEVKKNRKKMTFLFVILAIVILISVKTQS